MKRFADEFFDELRQTAAITSEPARTNALAAAFTRFVDIATERFTTNFAGPFAKIDRLLKDHKADEGLALAVNDARRHLRRRHTTSCEQLADQFRSDFRAVADFMALVCAVELPDDIRKLNGSPVYAEPDPEFAEEETPDEFPVDDIPSIEAQHLRLIVDNVTGKTITAHADLDGSPVLTLDGSRRELAPVLGSIKEGDQLNLVCPRITGSEVTADFVIFEPDYLINITQITACMQTYGNDARLAVLNRFAPQPATPAIALGNFASQLLDEEIHGGSRPYTDSVRDFFRNNAVSLAACNIPPSFHNDAKTQQFNIHRAISEDMPQHIGHFDRRRVMLEPAFYSEMLGLQGRIDFMQLDFKVLVEQKSGKGEWPQGDFTTPMQTAQHYTQLLLYRAIMEYNYHDRFEANDRRLSAFLLYSRYTRPLLALDSDTALLTEAFAIRNSIVALEKHLAAGDTEFLDTLSPDALRHRTDSEKLWIQYQRPQLEAIIEPIRLAPPLEKAYFSRLLRFISNEHAAAKTGNKSKGASGFASTWQCPLPEKLDAGNIYCGLRLIQPQASHIGKVDRVVLAFTDDDTHDIANFRTGDMVMLYSYAPEAEPDACRAMVFRCIINSIDDSTVELSLRFSQSSPLPFFEAKNDLWAIEHDFMEASATALYQSVFTFLSAPEERRNLLLMRRRPATDRTRHTVLDHGTFAPMALRVKQADDLFLIIGPPGTGKTSFGMLNTLREQLSDGVSTAIVASYTNRAVDEICSKLVEAGIDFLRIGSLQSCAACYRPYMLQQRSAECTHISQVKSLINDSRVMVGTTASLNSAIGLLRTRSFSIAIIDEASQIIEPQLLQLLCSAGPDGKAMIRKIVMIGDHKQLPAVVQQSEAQSAVDDPALIGIGFTDCRMSLFERMLRRYGDDPAVTHMLTRQGRMHADIAALASEMFYGARLDTVPLRHQHTALPDLGGSGLAATVLNTTRMAFVDVCEAPSCDLSDKVNMAEAAVVAAFAKEIMRREPDFDPAFTLGVIVPYRNQIAAVRKAMAAEGITCSRSITIDTVERFQGSQRDYIIYAFTVKRPYQLRFLSENSFTDETGAVIDRKLNVALTRARLYTVVTGNSALLRKNPVFANLIDRITARGGYFQSR